MNDWQDIFPESKYFALHGIFDNNREVLLYSYTPRTTTVRDSGSYLVASIYPGVNRREKFLGDFSAEATFISELSDEQVLSLWEYSKSLIKIEGTPASCENQESLAREILASRVGVSFPVEGEQ